MCFDRFHWSLGDDSSHSPFSGSGGGKVTAETRAELSWLVSRDWIFITSWVAKCMDLPNSRFTFDRYTRFRFNIMEMTCLMCMQ